MPFTQSRAACLGSCLLSLAQVAGCSEDGRRAPQADAAAATEAGSSRDAATDGALQEAPVDARAEDGALPGPGDPKDASGDPNSAVEALPSAGCTANANTTYTPGTTPGQLTHAELARTFRVHVPPSYSGTEPLPLVLMLHGGGGSGRQLQENSADMDPIADREGFITVYPDGTGLLRTWNGGGCCGSAVQNDIDDVGFIAALLDELERTLCTDTRRTFATGMSNGGILAHRLACELSERIAAIAPVAGTNNTALCEPTRPVSVMQIHGTDDGHVPWDGGEGCGPAGVPFNSVPATMAAWATSDGCGDASAPYFDEGDGHCTARVGCTDGTDVVLCAVDGGGHSWPGGQPPAGLVVCPGNGGQSSTFKASEAAWQFFVDHPRR